MDAAIRMDRMSSHMPHTTLRFLLSELRTIRLKCLACRTNAAIEMPIAKLDRIEGFCCPICKESFDANRDGKDYLAMLQDAVSGLQNAAKKLQIEFVLPVEEAK